MTGAARRGDWLSGSRGELGAERILAAAGELFACQGPATVGMNDIARAAGCSRATLYRYFENREALHAAYVHRQAREVHRRLGIELAGIDDPRHRLTTGFLYALDLVRADPALRSWFAAAGPPLGAEIAEGSAVIVAMATAFVTTLGGRGPADVVDRRARWLLRALTSLLIMPGRDADEERAMIEEFLVPVLLPAPATR